MVNLTIGEFYEELEKPNTTIRDLVVENLDMAEYTISKYGHFLGYNIFLSTDNMNFWLKDRFDNRAAVIEGCLIGKGGSKRKQRFRFSIGGDLEHEVWCIVRNQFVGYRAD